MHVQAGPPKMTRAFFVVLLVALATAAHAQTEQKKGGVPTPRYGNSPFGSDWAKPYPQTGGQIYNDPRSQGSTQPQRPYLQSRCPRGTFDPNTGVCR
jgi:hypothetical protein